MPVFQEFGIPGTIPWPKIGGGESIGMPSNIETQFVTFVHSPKIGLLNGNQLSTHYIILTTTQMLALLLQDTNHEIHIAVCSNDCSSLD